MGLEHLQSLFTEIPLCRNPTSHFPTVFQAETHLDYCSFFSSSFIFYSASSFIIYKRKISFVSPYSRCWLCHSLRLADAFQRERAVLTAAATASSKTPWEPQLYFYFVTVLLKDCGYCLGPPSALVSTPFIQR